jgi:hypothetical protein
MSRNADAEAEFFFAEAEFHPHPPQPTGQPSTAVAAVFTASRSAVRVASTSTNRRGGMESCRRRPPTARAEARTRLSNRCRPSTASLVTNVDQKLKLQTLPRFVSGKQGEQAKPLGRCRYRFLRSHRRAGGAGCSDPIPGR